MAMEGVRPPSSPQPTQTECNRESISALLADCCRRADTAATAERFLIKNEWNAENLASVVKVVSDVLQKILANLFGGGWCSLLYYHGGRLELSKHEKRLPWEGY